MVFMIFEAQLSRSSLAKIPQGPTSFSSSSHVHSSSTLCSQFTPWRIHRIFIRGGGGVPQVQEKIWEGTSNFVTQENLGGYMPPSRVESKIKTSAWAVIHTFGIGVSSVHHPNPFLQNDHNKKRLVLPIFSAAMSLNTEPAACPPGSS